MELGNSNRVCAACGENVFSVVRVVLAWVAAAASSP
jgi:hypothetical protein